MSFCFNCRFLWDTVTKQVWDTLTSYQSKVTVCGTLSSLSKQKSLGVGQIHQTKVIVCWTLLHLTKQKSLCVVHSHPLTKQKVTAHWTLSSLTKQSSLCVGLHLKKMNKMTLYYEQIKL